MGLFFSVCMNFFLTVVHFAEATNAKGCKTPTVRATPARADAGAVLQKALDAGSRTPLPGRPLLYLVWQGQELSVYVSNADLLV